MSDALPETSYLICTLPRSGSWLLAEALEALKVVGRPREFFAPEQRQNLLKRWGIKGDVNFADFFRLVILHGTSRNGVFGAKLHWYQMEALLTEFRALPRLSRHKDSTILFKFFPGAKYIWLRRRNRRRQAVSYAKAGQSNEWWRIRGVKAPGVRDLELEYRFEQIWRLEGVLNYGDEQWAKLFAELRKEPLVIYYEDLLSDYDGSVRNIIEYIGVDLPTERKIPKPRLQRQADHLTEEWLAQYEAESSEKAPAGLRRA
jgi:LPS sulfotransferase NodH